jgi:hypothetical protein
MSIGYEIDRIRAFLKRYIVIMAARRRQALRFCKQLLVFCLQRGESCIFSKARL